MPAPAPVMTATPPAKASRTLTGLGIGSGSAVGVQLRRQDRIGGVQDDVHCRELQSVRASAHIDLGYPAGHRERHEVSDLVDENVEACAGDVAVGSRAMHICGVVAQRVRALVAMLGEAP